MINIDLIWQEGRNFWMSQDAPEVIKQLGKCAWVGKNKYFSNVTKEYGVHETLRKRSDIDRSSVQTGSIHARSCYLGSDSNGYFYFTKGIGWIFADGWEPSFGSLGILPLWAATREQKIAELLAKFEIQVVEPMAIFLHQKIPHNLRLSKDFIESSEVKDLDGSQAAPSMYIYRSKTRWRLADLAYMNNKKIKKYLFHYGSIDEWFENLLREISQSCAILHRIGGHDYSISPHNIFINSQRLDFEYVYCNELPHKEISLNNNFEVWRKKELYGLQVMAWEITELLGLKWTSMKLNQIIKNGYEKNCDFKFPYL